MKIASKTFGDCSPVQVFDSYISESCVAKMLCKKNRNCNTFLDVFGLQYVDGTHLFMGSTELREDCYMYQQEAEKNQPKSVQDGDSLELGGNVYLTRSATLVHAIG